MDALRTIGVALISGLGGTIGFLPGMLPSDMLQE
jgi:hypothetical protein